jgi:hypothetical protein
MNPQLTLNAASKTATHELIAEFNGVYNNNVNIAGIANSFSITVRLANLELYLANKDSVNADLLAFKDELIKHSGILPEEETNEEE